MAKYQSTKKIKTTKEVSEVLEIIESAFRNVSDETKLDGNTIKANSIDATFGSINRSDTTVISVVKKDDGYLLIADTNYKPSTMFWVFLALDVVGSAAGGAGILGFIIQFYFYFSHKKRVVNEIDRTLNNIVNLI
jgi:hypothetical protein